MSNQQENFWLDLPKPFFILAPMEDVTDVIFRNVVSEAGRPDVFFTEFTNSESIGNPDGIYSVRGRLTYTENEQPLVAHIWGNKPEMFRKMSIALKDMGFKGIDLNMGCPVANVASQGRGSGLINHPETAAEIIQASKEGGLPISVKTRLGYLEVDEWREWLTHILKQDIANLTIHLRTRKEMSKVDAHWELIPEIKQLRDEIAPNTLLTINGDIMDRKMGLELAEKYGVDGIMIGRGIFTNPFAFNEEADGHKPEEYLELLRLHLQLFEKYAEETERPYVHLLRFFKIYVKDFDGAVELKDKLMKTKEVSQSLALVNEALATFNK